MPTNQPAKSGPILTVSQLTRRHKAGEGEITVLEDVSFSIARGATAAIVGPSGSGKTTLLGLCAGLDLPSAGSVVFDGHSLEKLNEDERAKLRNRGIGFVFQNFQLLPALTALENVMVPLELQGIRLPRCQAAELLERVGLAHRLGHYPQQLSGGEQQRVALARAFIHQPPLLLADEPTGNLDDETSGPIIEMLFGLNRDAGTALVLVTHDMDLAERCEQLIRLRGGKVAPALAESLRERE